MLVTSKKKTANRNFEGHLLCVVGALLFLPTGMSGVSRAANEYPENINAIGRIGKINLFTEVLATRKQNQKAE